MSKQDEIFEKLHADLEDHWDSVIGELRELVDKTSSEWYNYITALKQTARKLLNKQGD